ncbi:MAG: hypothetical protein ACJ73J_09120 [Actinomycetes bacterium]
MTLQVMARCAALAAWSSAVLRQEVGVEQAIDALHANRCEPVVTTELAGPAVQHERFALSVGRWRSVGVSGWRYVPVAPADSQGVPGPPDFRARAVDVGAALVSIDGPSVGLVAVPPATTNPGQPAPHFLLAELATTSHGTAPPESVSELDRALLTSLSEVVEGMEGLELARWRDDVEDLLLHWGEPPHMPPGTSSRAQRLAARSERVLALIELASDDEGGSRTAAEMSYRASALRDLGRISRAAHAAAWNAGVSDALAHG